MSKTKFYHDEKKHLSPSSIHSWLNTPAAFRSLYFEGNPIPSNKYMDAGTTVHGLIENGVLDVFVNLEHKEKPLSAELDGYKVYGIPDGYESDDGEALFVDYKTGVRNAWSDESLKKDDKMLITAWLVWKNTDEPETVTGFIEYIPTKFFENSSELESTGTSKVTAKHVYTQKDMERAEKTIKKVAKEVNKDYEEWLESTDVFVSDDDVEEFVKLDKEKKELETKIADVKQRIEDQMMAGNAKRHTVPQGTFYFTTKENYVIPDTWEFTYKGKKITLSEFREIEKAKKAAEKNYKKEHEPDSTVKSFSFRSK